MRPKKDITANYWQYAVTENGIQRLRLKQIHRGMVCKDIPRGNLC